MLPACACGDWFSKAPLIEDVVTCARVKFGCKHVLVGFPFSGYNRRFQHILVALFTVIISDITLILL